MMASSIIAPILVSVALGIIGFLTGKISVKSKTEILYDALHKRMDKVDERMNGLEESVRILLSSTYTLLLLGRDKMQDCENANGELDKALETLNNHMIENMK